MIAPLLFVIMTILGGALWPGYSHISETVSELFSPGSPNKLLLDTLHTIFAILLISFGIEILHIRGSKLSVRIGKLGAALFIAMGSVSVATATIFRQDPWGSPSTFRGEIHIILSGIVGLLSILSMLSLGIWFIRAAIFPSFGIYSFITISLVFLSIGFFMANVGGSIMGLAERITILIGFQWTFSLAFWMVLQ
jgi:hypothetical protein